VETSNIGVTKRLVVFVFKITNDMNLLYPLLYFVFTFQIVYVKFGLPPMELEFSCFLVVVIIF